MVTTGAYGWGLAAVVIVSWFFYLFVAPRTWREWTRAGLVRAFVIASYAEMYGFPEGQVMKEIKAYIRRSALVPVLDALRRAGAPEVGITEAHMAGPGCGG